MGFAWPQCGAASIRVGFTLLAFGGAAGLHITAVAAELGISRVAVPLAASVLSAWGMLNTDLRVELSRSQGQAGSLDTAALRAAFAAMEEEGRARLAWFDGEVTLHRSADMRYGEQVFEIPVDLDDVDWASPALAANLADRFHAAHERLYTYALRDQEAVLVNARLSVIGRLPQVERVVPDVSAIEVRSEGATPDLSWRLDGGACVRLSGARGGPMHSRASRRGVRHHDRPAAQRRHGAFRRAGLAGGDN